MPRPPMPCLVCGKLTSESRCEEHQPQRRRPSHPGRTRPGHSKAHADARKHWKPWVDAGTWPCSRCGEAIREGQPWDVDQRPWGMEPAHARCNRRAGALGEP
jgi:hypothetical protein